MREKFSRLKKSTGSFKKLLPVFLLAMFLGLFVFVKPASAGISYYIWTAISLIAEMIASLMGSLLLFVVNFLINVSGYNNFINASVVEVGWKLVRDVANMFYILIMLVMAFGTMLKLEQYTWKKMLPRLIGTAILVNFSKTIIGLIIDFGQVVMLTFVNAYAATAGGNFAQLFGIKDILELSKKDLSDPTDADTGAMYHALGFVLGAIILTVATIVTGIFAIILLLRIITLWILIVLSPLAFLLGTFERGREYYKEWWKDLVNNVVMGPIVAFFLWLTLATMGQGGQMAQIKANNALPAQYIDQSKNEAGYYQDIAGTEISKWENMGSLLVALAMLFYALEQIGKLAKLGGDLAKGASKFMTDKASAAVKKAVIPAALLATTGGGIPSAAVKLGGLRMGMDFAQRLPLVGGAFKAIRKDADKFGLGPSGKIVKGMEAPLLKGVAKGVGKTEGLKGVTAAYAGGIKGAMAGEKGVMGKTKAALSEVKKGGVGGFLKAAGAGVAGLAGGYVAGGARQMRAEVLGEERKAAREGIDQRKELERQERVDAAAKGKYTPLADKTNQRLFADQSYVLKDAKARKMMREQYPDEFKAMVAGYQDLADKTGNTEAAQGTLKDLFKSDPQLAPPTKDKDKPARIHEIVTGGNGMSLSPDALSNPDVVKELSQTQREKILKEGDADQQRALGLSLLAEKTGIARDDLDKASSTSVPTDLEAKVDAVLSSLPDGAFKQLGNIFDLLSAGLQAKVAAANPEVVSARHLVDSAGTATATGQELAKQIATTASDTAVQQLSSRLGEQFKTALTAANTTSPLDGKALNVLASMQRDSASLLALFKTGGAFDPGKLANAVKASNAHMMLKKMASADVISGGHDTEAGEVIYNNISVNMLSKLVGEAKKPGASGALKDTVASIAALVEQAHASGKNERVGTEKKQLEKLLESQSTLEAIDIAAKSAGLTLR